MPLKCNREKNAETTHLLFNQSLCMEHGVTVIWEKKLNRPLPGLSRSQTLLTPKPATTWAFIVLTFYFLYTSQLKYASPNTISSFAPLILM